MASGLNALEPMGNFDSPGEIDRGGRQPLYAQIKTLLVQELNASPLGERRIFSDSVLMRRFAVSRMTVRNAVAELVREGVVERVPGRGTFLRRHPSLAVRLDGLERFLQEWRLPHLRTRTIGFRRAAPPPEVAARLLLPPKGPALTIKRLREQGEDEPVVLDVRYVAPWCSSGLTRADSERQSLFVSIAEHSGVEAARVEQEIKALGADESVAATLKIAPGTAILGRQVTFYAADDRPMITGESFYRSDRFTFQVRASREGRRP